MRSYLDHALRDAGRIELRHQDGDRWVSGLFDDIDALRAEIRLRADRGNLFTSINAPKLLRASNAMCDQALRDTDIVVHTRLPFDFDPVRPKNTPSTDEELAAAVGVRNRLMGTLSGLGWPAPAVACSGNGAHLLYRVRLPASADVAEMLTAIYKGLREDFTTTVVDFDPTVRNPARIWRLYGCTNRKGAYTPTRPHRRAVAAIPGRWEAVSMRQLEELAAHYARRQERAAAAMLANRTVTRVVGAGDYSTLDAPAWFAAHGAHRRHLGHGKHAVTCPWSHQHSTEPGPLDTSTVLWETTGANWPTFHCSHAHCQGRGIADVLALWGDADGFCARAWARPS
jgi:hypothetical protein